MLWGYTVGGRRGGCLWMFGLFSVFFFGNVILLVGGVVIYLIIFFVIMIDLGKVYDLIR